MRLLLTNDDGINAPGILALIKEFYLDYDVDVVAPDMERSGAGHSFTFITPLRARNVSFQGLEKAKAFAVSGTPVDCVKLGVGNLSEKPDMVVSGINFGPNLGTDVLYSGTVSAAMEAALMGIPSIAVSLCAFEPQNWETASFAARKTVEMLRKNPLNAGTVLNINVPDLPLSEIKGTKLTRLSRQQYKASYDERTDPYGRRYYWTPSDKLTKCEPGEDTDESWIRDGYISLTPLTVDIADYKCMLNMREYDYQINK
jgi:5'-nucleotidase